MFIHSQKRNPQTHLKDPNMVWDFFVNHPMVTHQVNQNNFQSIHFSRINLFQFLFLYSDRGIPDGFRHMHGYGSHTFKMVNDKNEFFWVKFHFRVTLFFFALLILQINSVRQSEQGIKNLDPTKAKILAGEQPDYALADLYNAIAKKDYPSWTLYIQVQK